MKTYSRGAILSPPPGLIIISGLKPDRIINSFRLDYSKSRTRLNVGFIMYQTFDMLPKTEFLNHFIIGFVIVKFPKIPNI